MSALQNKIDFVAFLSVKRANPNGDPLSGNRPRVDTKGIGFMTGECVKRKIRNRMQDLGHPIFVQPADRCDDGKKSLKERADALLKNEKDQDRGAKAACAAWLDVRSFGQVFAFSNNEEKKGSGVSISVRGPVTVWDAVSVSPVDVESVQITKSVNGMPGEKRSPDTMGQKHFVRFGLYKVQGAINVQLAEKTGFSQEDALVVRECLRTLFHNDASAARPEGSMTMVALYWFQHDQKEGRWRSDIVHNSVQAVLKEGVTEPSSADDYELKLTDLPGLTPEILRDV